MFRFLFVESEIDTCVWQRNLVDAGDVVIEKHVVGGSICVHGARQNAPIQTGLQHTNQTVNDGVAHSKNPQKCAYHVTFDLDLDLEHTLDAC